MTALAESGRSKVDVEISYSSSNCPPGMSTAEFANSHQELQHQHQLQQNRRPKVSQQQQQQQQQQQMHQQLHQGRSDESQMPWSTRLRSVPLSIEFDVSVFATQDRHGRLTLHPVLRAIDSSAAAAAAAAASMSAGAPSMTSRAVAQSLALRGSSVGVGVCGQGADGDLGRNNCAKAASFVVQCPLLARGGCGQRLVPHQLAETDLSTATRASCSGVPMETAGPTPEAAASAPKAGTAVAGSAPRLTGDAVIGPAPETAKSVIPDWPNHPIVRRAYRQLDDDNVSVSGSCDCSSLSVPSLVIGTHQKDKRKFTLNQHDRQQQQSTAWCEDCQSALPRFTAMSNQSGSAADSDQRHHLSVSSGRARGGHGGGVGGGVGGGRDGDACLDSNGSGGSSSHRRQRRRVGSRQLLSVRSLERVVRKLESLLDRVDPRQLKPAAPAAAAPASPQLPQSPPHPPPALTSVSPKSPGGPSNHRAGRQPQSNLSVTDLRLEYSTLFRD